MVDQGPPLRHSFSDLPHAMAPRMIRRWKRFAALHRGCRNLRRRARKYRWPARPAAPWRNRALPATAAPVARVRRPDVGNCRTRARGKRGANRYQQCLAKHHRCILHVSPTTTCGVVCVNQRSRAHTICASFQRLSVGTRRAVTDGSCLSSWIDWGDYGMY